MVHLASYPYQCWFFAGMVRLLIRQQGLVFTCDVVNVPCDSMSETNVTASVSAGTYQSEQGYNSVARVEA